MSRELVAQERLDRVQGRFLQCQSDPTCPPTEGLPKKDLDELTKRYGEATNRATAMVRAAEKLSPGTKVTMQIISTDGVKINVIVGKRGYRIISKLIDGGKFDRDLNSIEGRIPRASTRDFNAIRIQFTRYLITGNRGGTVTKEGLQVLLDKVKQNGDIDGNTRVISLYSSTRKLNTNTHGLSKAERKNLDTLELLSGEALIEYTGTTGKIITIKIHRDFTTQDFTVTEIPTESTVPTTAP